MHALRTAAAATLALALAAVMLTVGACRSHKEATTDPTAAAQADPVTRVNLNRLTATALRGKISLTVRHGQNKLNVGGRLRMKRNEVVQLSLMPYGLVEVGVVELTPDYFLLVDKWGKQYVRARWSDVKAFDRANIDFYTFQALFWEELFIPGKRDKAPAADFDVTLEGETMRLQPTTKAVSQKDATLAFTATTVNGLIRQTRVTAPGSTLRFEWNYSDWTNIERRDFPGTMEVALRTDHLDVGATFRLSSMQADAKMKDIRTSVNTDYYRQVDIESILTHLMSR